MFDANAVVDIERNLPFPFYFFLCLMLLDVFSDGLFALKQNTFCSPYRFSSDESYTTTAAEIPDLAKKIIMGVMPFFKHVGSKIILVPCSVSGVILVKGRRQ